MMRIRLTVTRLTALTATLGLMACGSSSSSPTGGGDNGLTAALGKACVVNTITLPDTRDKYSIDLDGDGKKDNALANIVTVLGSQGLDTQSGVTASVTSGTVIMLFQNSPTGTADSFPVTFNNGVAAAKPDYTGAGSFTIDSKFAASKFSGTFSGSSFNSANPAAKGAVNVTAQLQLAIVSGAPPVVLPTNGTHLDFTWSNGGIMSGEIQGSVKISDLQTQVLPAVAKFLTDKVMAAPNDPGNKSIEMLFDTGGCSDNGVPAKAGDNIITPCELAGADLIKNLLGADIQAFADSTSVKNADGTTTVVPGTTYGPNPAKTNKDSLSLAIGFTAVAAASVK